MVIALECFIKKQNLTCGNGKALVRGSVALAFLLDNVDYSLRIHSHIGCI